METTEKIVESYCRYVKQCFTIPNIKYKGHYEIDLLVVDTTLRRIKRYHVECGVSISGSYSKLTSKDFTSVDPKIRVKQAGQRRTMAIHRKFDLHEVETELKKYEFADGNYSKIVVTWGWTPQAKEVADRENIALWDFLDLLQEIASASKDTKTYFTDDTARTIQLFAKAMDLR